MQLVEQVRWIKPLGAHYALGLDGIGLTLVLLVVIVTPVVIIASWRDFDDRRRMPAAARAGTGSGRATARTRSPRRSTTRRVVLRPGARCRDLRAVPVPGHRRLLVLRVLRGHPDPDVLPDRRLRAGARRAYAASKFLIFGLLGGFVMLASVIGLYVLSAQAGERQLPAVAT